jgi:hypothetical protein
MRVLHFSIFIILVSIMIIPNALASHDSEKEWGTVSVDKPVLELPYTTASNAQYEKIKIFGTVEEQRSAAFVYMTISEPDGKTYQVKVRVVEDTNERGYYENFVLICCNNAGTYSVYVEWKGYHIGTVTIDVSAKPKSQPTDTLTAEPVTIIPNWIKIHAGWWAGGQINDSTYLLGIQYLIQEGIMIIPHTETSDDSDAIPDAGQRAQAFDQRVPAWIKNNAGWWATDQIDDITYISGIQYLVSIGIIEVS